MFEIAAYRTRHDPEHDIVDGDSQTVLDHLGLVERNARERDTSLRGDRRAPRRARRRQRHGADRTCGVAPVADDVRDALHRAPHERHGACRAPQPRSERTEDHLDIGGHGLGWGGHDLGSGWRRRFEVVQLGHDLRAGGPIDRSVVDLGDEADAVMLQALDDPDLPERFGPVEWHRRDLGCDRREFASPTWLGGGDAADVIVGIKIGILDPHRMVQLERNFDEASGEGRNRMEPPDDVIAKCFERVAVGHGGGVVDPGHADVHVSTRRLQVKK